MKNTVAVCLRGWRREASKERNMQSSHFCGRFHPIAHVWAFIVVEINDSFHNALRLLHIFGTFHFVEPLLLDDTVHPFSYGIIRWISILWHAVGGAHFLESFHIQVTAVL